MQAANPVSAVEEFSGHERHAVAPSVAEYVPAEQLLHAPTPAENLYFPAVHTAHLPPAAFASPEKPAMHLQSVSLFSEIPSELEFAAHKMIDSTSEKFPDAPFKSKKFAALTRNEYLVLSVPHKG
jgi:hypothetical protein